VNIALLSDFGWSDGYVGALKGAVLAVCPQGRLIDLTHEIPPGDVVSGSRALARAFETFPPGTVFLSVVDPGVGSARRALAAEIDGRFHVAPDNGLLSGVLELARQIRAVSLERREHWRTPDPSPVFHGRDLFAPVAGFLARGGALAALGPELDPGLLIRFERPQPRCVGDAWHGEVVSVDRFGNLATNLPARPGARGRVEVAGQRLELRQHYAQVAAGDLLALIGSDGCIEIAQCGGRANERLGAIAGLLVVWHPFAGGSP